MPQYPDRISRFKKWARLKIDSGHVGLGDKQSSRSRGGLRRNRRKRRKRLKD